MSQYDTRLTDWIKADPDIKLDYMVSFEDQKLHLHDKIEVSLNETRLLVVFTFVLISFDCQNFLAVILWLLY